MSHATGHKVAECRPAIDYSKHLALVVAIWPFEPGRIVGLRAAGWTYSRIVAQVGHNLCVAAFSSSLWNILTSVDQVLNGRIVQTHVKIDAFCGGRRTSYREAIRAHVAPAMSPRAIGNRILAAEL